MVYSSKLVRRV